MADIFISYARHDKAHAERIASALQAQGLSVWWDPAIMPHEAFHDVIDRELDGASGVLVVWSERSSRSRWVRSEATSGLERNEVIQVRVDGARPPRPFDQYQIADLSSWQGEPDHPQWRMVVKSAKTLASRRESLEGAPLAQPVPPAAPPLVPAPPRKRGWLTLAAVVAAGLVVAIAGGVGAAAIMGSGADPSGGDVAEAEPDPLAAIRPSVVLIAKDGDGIGSGFFVAPDLVLTSGAVVFGIDGRTGRLQVSNPRLGVRDAELVAAEGPGELGQDDFGLLRVANAGATPLVLSPGAQVAQRVVSTDYRPLAMQGFAAVGQAPDPTVHEGRIVGLQPLRGEPVIMHSVSVVPGTSGSPLTDVCGRALGMNVAFMEVGGERTSLALPAERVAGFAQRNGVSVPLRGGPCP